MNVLLPALGTPITATFTSFSFGFDRFCSTFFEFIFVDNSRALSYLQLVASRQVYLLRRHSFMVEIGSFSTKFEFYPKSCFGIVDSSV